jgi:hypothetical protein
VAAVRIKIAVAAVAALAALAALAPLAGCGTAVNGAHGGSQGSGTGVTMGGGSTPGTSAPNGEITVTEADSGKTVHLRIGQRLRVMLVGHGMQWHRATSPEPTLRVAEASGGYPSAGPAVVVFVAVRSGTASVSSITDHPCLHASPPCKIAQRIWSLRVVVAGAS